MTMLCSLNHIRPVRSMSHSAKASAPGFAVFHVPRGRGGVWLPALPAGAPHHEDTMVDVGDEHVGDHGMGAVKKKMYEEYEYWLE